MNPRQQPQKKVEVIATDLRLRGLLGLAERVARNHRVTLDEMLGPRHCPAFARARQELWSVVYDLLRSTTVVGEIFDRDHSTIIYGMRAHAARAPVVVVEEGDILQ